MEPIANSISIPELPSKFNNGIQFREDVETIIRLTTYDLQTNSSCQQRLIREEDSSMVGTWTMGMEATNYPNRGTGYNTTEDGAWGNLPDVRLEAEVRTGWLSTTRTRYVYAVHQLAI